MAQVGDFVEWNLAVFTGVDLTPSQGFVIAANGEWVAVKRLRRETYENPFLTLNKRDVKVLPQTELVRRGAYMID